MRLRHDRLIRLDNADSFQDNNFVADKDVFLVAVNREPEIYASRGAYRYDM